MRAVLACFGRALWRYLKALWHGLKAACWHYWYGSKGEERLGNYRVELKALQTCPKCGGDFHLQTNELGDVTATDDGVEIACVRPLEQPKLVCQRCGYTRRLSAREKLLVASEQTRRRNEVAAMVAEILKDEQWRSSVD